MTSSEPRDIDDILDILGAGRWNIFIFVLCSLSALRIPPQMLSASYVVPAVNFTCAAYQQLAPETSPSSPESAGHTRGRTTDQPASVQRWSGDGTTNETRSAVQDQCDHFDIQQQLHVPCERWVYSDSVFHTTITSAFDLVCGRSYLRSMYTSMYMFGAMVGSVCVGYMADWRGRKLPLAVSLVGYAISPLAMSWIPSFEIILMCRLLLGFFHPLLLTSFYTIALEVTQPKYRATVGVLTALPWALGTIAWAGLGYLIRDWQWLILTATVPSFLFIPCIWLVDESPRWLVVHGHHDKALKIFKKAARINRKELPSEADMRNIMEITQKNAAIHDARSEATGSAFKRRLKEMRVLFSTRALRLRTFTMWVLFFVASMVFYGLSLSAVSFSADPFIYMAVGGLMEVPAYTITVPIIDYWGRRLPTALSYLVCGLNILALTFIPKSHGWLVITLAMIGKLGISMAYQIVYMYILELLPTEVRLQGLGSCMVASRVGSILSPFITDFLGEIIPWLPSTIFGMASLVAGILTLVLPETNKQHMPDTVAELEPGATVVPDDESTTEKKVTIEVPEMEKEEMSERPSKFKRIRNWRQQTGHPRKSIDSDVPLRQNPEFAAKVKEKQTKHPTAIDEEEDNEVQ